MVPRLAALLLVAVALAAQGPPLPADLGQMLRASGFGRGDLAELAAGQAISRLLDDSTDDQTAAVAAVRIRGSHTDLVQHLRAIEKS